MIKDILPLHLIDKYPWLAENKIYIYNYTNYITQLGEYGSKKPFSMVFSAPKPFEENILEQLKDHFIFFGPLSFSPTGPLTLVAVFQPSNDNIFVIFPSIDEKDDNKIKCFVSNASRNIAESAHLFKSIEGMYIDDNKKSVGFMPFTQ